MWWIVQVFLHLRTFLFFFVLFSLDKEFWIEVYFFQHFKLVASIFFSLPLFFSYLNFLKFILFRVYQTSWICNRIAKDKQYKVRRDGIWGGNPEKYIHRGQAYILQRSLRVNKNVWKMSLIELCCNRKVRTRFRKISTKK